VKISKKLGKSFLIQQGNSDCGVACLASVINYHGGDTSIEYLRKISGTSKKGTTLLGLLQAAKQSGFEAEGLEAESIENLKEINEPAILHIVIENRLQHYVVFFGFDGDKIVLGDPVKGIGVYTNAQLETIWQSKTLLKLSPTSTFEKKESVSLKKKTWFIDLIYEDLPLLLVSLFLGIIISVLSVSTAIFSQKLVDDILPKENTQKLVLSLVLVLFLLLARSGLNYLRGFFMIRQGMDFNNRIIQSFYGNLLQLPKSFFDTRKTGELIARMNDTRRIQNTISVLTGSVLIDFLSVLVSICFVFSYTSIIGFMALGILLLYSIILFYFNKPIADLQKETMNGYAMAESNFIDTIQGIADIKLSNKVSFFEKMNRSVYGLFQQKSFELGKVGIRFSMLSEITGVIFIVSVFGISSWLVLSNKLLLGEMIALSSMAGGLIPSVTRLVVANIQLQEARIAFERMFEFTQIEKENLTVSDRVANTFNELEINNVSFRFPGRKQILKEVSLNVLKGEIVALLGESGGGKSTLLQLVQKFYKPESGTFFFNKTDFDEISITELRRQISCVPQELKIFNGNLLFNITLSDQQEDYKQAITLCEDFGLNDFFNSFPQGYQTLLGEEGINISGGQKQLVVLARALFRKPKLLLLDEATSAMDRNTENFILSLLQKLKSEMGVIMVTHRIKTAQRCDRIYILENGVISITGTPKELMCSENFYSESYKELIS
jgi:ATP-binding cassette subfamily B protein